MAASYKQTIKTGEIVALELGGEDLLALRVKKTGSELHLVACDVFPLEEIQYEGRRKNVMLALPKPFKSSRPVLTLTPDESIIRLIHFKEMIDQSPRWVGKVRENLGLDKGFRLSYTVDHPGKGPSRSLCLALGIPEKEVERALDQFSGVRTMLSLEVSLLAAMNAFAHGVKEEISKDTVALLVTSKKDSLLCILHKGLPVLVRKFDMGVDAVTASVSSQMGVQKEVAAEMLMADMFDLNEAVKSAITPFLSQLSISRDFAERYANCSIERLYACGPLAGSAFWINAIENASQMKVDTWDAFSLLNGSGILTERAVKNRNRFTGVIGAAVGAFKEE